MVDLLDCICLLKNFSDTHPSCVAWSLTYNCMQLPHMSSTEKPSQFTMLLSTLRIVPSGIAQALAMPSEGRACGYVNYVPS